MAKEIREELAEEVRRLHAERGVVPGLVTVLVGKNPGSDSYVRAKQKTAHELGFCSVQDHQPENISAERLLALIDGYNRDPKIQGILVRLPLPRHHARSRRRGTDDHHNADEKRGQGMQGPFEVTMPR